ncbi:MAG TPA: trigger factor [Thermomicrobiales bacterium]
MKVTVERLPASQVLLDIAADEDEFNEAVEKAARRLAREAVIPGFRKGKVPRHILERLVGREVFVEEANRSLMDDLYRRALQQEELIPVGDPDVEFVQAEPLAFKVTVPVYPDVDPGAYRDVRIEPVDASIDEAKVDEVIERLRVSQSPWVDPAEPRTPREGDQVTVDITITEGEEEFQPPLENGVFVLGEDQLLEELRTAIEGLKVGESTSVEISYPEEGENAPNDRRRGKTLTYTITLKELKERDLLPLDDDFAKTYANADSLEALRERVRANLHAERTREARAEAINQIVDKMVEGATVEIPQAMIEDALDEEIEQLRQRLSYRRISLEAYLRSTNQTEAELRDELREGVERRLRTTLVLREIAEREGIEVAESDVESEIDELTAGADEAQRDQLRALYRADRQFRSAVRNELFDRRLTDRLIEIATEGRGPVVNGWEPPAETEEATSDGADAAEAAEASAEQPAAAAATESETASESATEEEEATATSS